MSRPSVRRIAAVLLLAAVFLPLQSASAAPRAASPGFWPRLATLLASLWPDHGCILDPSGLCASGANSAPAADHGCGIDPDGLCTGAAPALAISPDEGCIIDPNGRCKGGL
ncbi:MAG TPA: hypothetical protein VH988_10020 [Thermoanaerobaculia bacterium]|nr:hypothetical protein [Thermoanaerobaculia bacterium]